MFNIPVVNDEPLSKSRRSGIMLCTPFEEKRLQTWKPPYIIQPKLDGVRCRALIDEEGNVNLISSEGHTIDAVPHVGAHLMSSGITNVELDGELYTHGMSFQDIFSRTSRSRNRHSDAGKIEFHVFDIVSSGYQVDRLSKLNQLGFYLQDSCVKVVPSSLARNIDDVMDFYKQYLDKGYEGFILRNCYAEYKRKRSTDIMKFKPHQVDDYLIVSYLEEISKDGNNKGTLGAFICRGNDNTLFSVGSGFTREQREEYWKHREELMGKRLKVKYQALTQGRGVPRFPVALDVISNDKI